LTHVRINISGQWTKAGRGESLGCSVRGRGDRGVETELRSGRGSKWRVWGCRLCGRGEGDYAKGRALAGAPGTGRSVRG